MRMTGATLELSATDLSQFLGCRHLTALNMQVAMGARQAPAWVDPLLRVLRERGLEHEHGYVETLRAQGLAIVDLSDLSDDEAIIRSVDAMRSGADVIVQPALRNGRWFGRPDILRRTDKPSGVGAWSYEVADTKLAKETRGGTILQLGLYSEQLGIVQAHAPGYVVSTWQLWEDLLTISSRIGFGRRAVLSKKGFLLGSRTRPSAATEGLSVYPDCVVEGTGSLPRFLLDAKYKSYVQRGPLRMSEADIYEAMAFSTATECPLVVLAYPAPADAASLALGSCFVFERVSVGPVHIAGVQVEVRGISQVGGLRRFSATLVAGLQAALGEEAKDGWSR